MTKTKENKLTEEELTHDGFIFYQGYQKSQEDVLKKINDLLYDYHERLGDERLPELVQANLSGMILGLEELKNKIINSQQDINTTGDAPTIKQTRETGLADGLPKDTQTHDKNGKNN